MLLDTPRAECIPVRFRSDRGTARARLTEVEVSKIAYNSIPDPAHARREFHRIIARDGMTGAPLQNGPGILSAQPGPTTAKHLRRR
jgi:hypothetical protein